MNPQIADKLVQAIYSGNYTPKPTDKPKLKHENTWGILGILCELYRLEHGGEWISSYYVLPGEIRGSKSKIPDAVVKWAGLIGPWMALPGVGLIGLMEERGYDHKVLAQIINDNWEYL